MRVIVSGMGAVSVLGKGLKKHVQELFYNVKNEEIQLAPYAPSHEALSKTPPDMRMIPLEEEKKYYENILARPLCRNSVMALMAFEELLADSELKADDLSHKKIAIVMGTTAGCSGTDTQYIEDFVMDRAPDPSRFKVSLLLNPATIIKEFLFSKKIEAEISVFLINNACTSSTDSIGLAAELIKGGSFDLAFAGGADEILFQTFYGFSSLQLISKKFSSQPFDKNRDGLLLTEGAAVLCLEKEDAYRRRLPHKKEWGEILGYETVSEVYHQTSPNPEAEGLKKITQSLLSKTKILAEEIDFINAHATGTPANDFSEGRFFAQNFPTVKVSATKGYTGHCLGAVGALEAVFCFLSMKEKLLPSTRGFTEVDSSIGIKPVTVQAEISNPRGILALSTSVGFGGINSALLLRGVAE